MNKKACYICGEVKPINQYHKSKDEYGDGSINWCKTCILMYHKMRKEKRKRSKYAEPLAEPLAKPHEFRIIFD